MSERVLGVGLYGVNGHVPFAQLAANPRTRLAAMAQIPEERLPPELAALPGLPRCRDLAELLAAPGVELVVLNSPRRDAQAADAERCLRAGRHVLAEKPAALVEPDLDRLLSLSREKNLVFREMSGSSFEHPFHAAGQAVRGGRIGRVVQVHAQKSYPMGAWRPQDEGVDGGLVAQAGVHALRWIVHGLGLEIRSVETIQTRAGNPVAGGGLRTAALLYLELAGGIPGSVAVNYCNPRGIGFWGNDCLQVWGTEGLVEIRAGESFSRLVTHEGDQGPLPAPATPASSWFDLVAMHILDGVPMPISLEDDLAPTRWGLRASKLARNLS